MFCPDKKTFFDQREAKKMSLSAQRSVVKPFKFNDKSIRAFYIKDAGQSLSSQDVYKAPGYDKENVAKAINELSQKSTKCDREMP